MGRSTANTRRAKNNAKWSLKNRQNGLCFWCKKPILDCPEDFRDRISAEHHPVRYEDGGTSGKHNIVAVHIKCNI